MTVYELKCWPEFFDAIAAGKKRHDLRRSGERDFQVGDIICLLEFDPINDLFTGRRQMVEITYITSASAPCAFSGVALQDNFCILSIAPAKE